MRDEILASSDEIFSLRLQMKSNPPTLTLRSKISSRSDFIHLRWIYSAEADLVEKSTSALQMCFFLYKGYEKDIFAFYIKVSNSRNILFFLQLYTPNNIESNKKQMDSSMVAKGKSCIESDHLYFSFFLKMTDKTMPIIQNIGVPINKRLDAK